nr:zonular occludens toxin domain-containing protein [Anoxybacillus sp.]
MIELYTGTIGSGKSYHALERILDALKKGKYVIANFPLNFTSGMVRRGYADRFMYVPDEFLMGAQGVIRLYRESMRLKSDGTHRFFGRESQCLVVIDEAGNYFAPEDYHNPGQRLWAKFFTLSRKLGYDFILISQTDKQINKVIRACVEYEVKHRKANRVFPFNLLPFTVFMYVTYWKQTRERLGASSSIFVKRFGDLFDTHKLFGMIDKDVDFVFSQEEKLDVEFSFGNCKVANEKG